MSPEERDAFLTQKRMQVRQQMRDRKREENAKQEDNEIECRKQIPQGCPVPLSPSLSQDQWARIVSVSEFVRCYKRLLVPSGELSTDDNSNAIKMQDLCRSVTGDSDEQHAALANLVCVLLKTLLQDNRVRVRRCLMGRSANYQSFVVAEPPRDGPLSHRAARDRLHRRRAAAPRAAARQ